MSSKKDTVEVQATGPIRHGDPDGTLTEYVEGDKFSVTLAQAKQLAETGAVVKPGTKPAVAKEAKDAAKTQHEIDEANAKAEAERKETAEAQAHKARG